MQDLTCTEIGCNAVNYFIRGSRFSAQEMFQGYISTELMVVDFHSCWNNTPTKQTRSNTHIQIRLMQKGCDLAA